MIIRFKLSQSFFVKPARAVNRRYSAFISLKVALADSWRAIMTTSFPAMISWRLNRCTSRILLLILFLLTAFPFFLETVIPKREEGRLFSTVSRMKYRPRTFFPLRCTVRKSNLDRILEEGGKRRFARSLKLSGASFLWPAFV
jgi:hypothetical protein